MAIVNEYIVKEELNILFKKLLHQIQANSISIKDAIEIYNKSMDQHQERLRDNLKENTKKLLSSYNELKVHCEAAIVSTEDTMPSSLHLVLSEIFDQNGFIKVQAICASKQRTELMLNHVDAMLEAYRKQCAVSDKPYFRLVVRYYIDKDDENEIAEDENIGTATFWRYLAKGLEDMSILLWGLW